MKKFFLGLFTLLSLNSFADCPGMTVFMNTWNVYCAGNCDGGGVASIGGGSGNYNITYYDNSFAVVGTGGPTVANLCAGSYYIVVQDITNACIDTSQFSILSPQPLSVSITSVNNSTCFTGCDGSISVLVNGGTAPYSFLWDDPSSQTTSTINGLCAGTYTVTVTDANGCVATVTATISSPAPINVSLSPTNPTACGLCDGSIVSSASGGVGSFVYSWSEGSTTANLSNLCAGNYMLTVVDANGCMQNASASLSVGGMAATAVNVVQASCNQCNGSADIIVTGGVGPYTYEMDSIQNTDGIFTGLCGGVHIAMVTDINGCTTYYTVTIGSTQTGSLSAFPIITNESGYNMTDGSIDLTVTSGVGPYTYLWNNGATTEDIFSLSYGNYGVWVTDSNGDCNYFSFFVNLTQSFGTVEGYLYNDNNQNCVYDAGDMPYANQYVMVGSYWAYTNAAGFYTINVPVGNYTVTPYNTTDITSGCNTSQSVTVTNGNTISNVNFSFFFVPYYDVCVSVFSLGIVPGFNGGYYVYVHNYGNMPADGMACITIPSPLTFTASSPAATSVSGDTVCVAYSNLLPGSYQYIYVGYFTPVSLPLGTSMTACAEVTITNGTDVNPGCNSYCYTRLVSGSFDPNDKSVSPTGENATGDVLVDETEFTYLINFQNTGTGPAVNIIVTDTLSAMLDPMSFEMLNSSHSYVVEMLPGNVIRWTFENIMLPDSGTNEPGSHGHVQFRMNTQNTPVVGQVITNTANIYFDFNEPVITNTAMNTFVSPSGVDEWSQEGIMHCYPNPANEVLYVQSVSGSANYTIYDLTGKVMLTQTSNSSNTTLDIQELSAGVYFLQSNSNEGNTTIKFIKR